MGVSIIPPIVGLVYQVMGKQLFVMRLTYYGEEYFTLGIDIPYNWNDNYKYEIYLMEQWKIAFEIWNCLEMICVCMRNCSRFQYKHLSLNNSHIYLMGGMGKNNNKSKFHLSIIFFFFFFLFHSMNVLGMLW